MPTTRLYEVKMKSKKKRYLVEATSREHAVRIATDPLVLSVTIPTPLEAIRLQGEGVEILTKANADAVVGGEPVTELKPITEAEAQFIVSEGDAGKWLCSNPPGAPEVFDTAAEAESRQAELRAEAALPAAAPAPEGC
jgi:hypothetical protein